MHSAASGLRLSARDLARVGLLVLGNGAVDGARIVTQAWIEASSKPVIPTGDGLGYGRSWYHLDVPAPAFPAPQTTVSGFGNGGQRLFLMPSAHIVCVTLSGAYDTPDQWVSPMRLWREIVLGSFLRA